MQWVLQDHCGAGWCLHAWRACITQGLCPRPPPRVSPFQHTLTVSNGPLALLSFGGAGSAAQCARCCAGARTFILVQGCNLKRPDISLEYRLSPGPVEASGHAQLVHVDELDEWDVAYLVEPQVQGGSVSADAPVTACLAQLGALDCLRMQESLAVRLPPALAETASAKYLILYFTRGTTCVGTCKLPLSDITQVRVRHGGACLGPTWSVQRLFAWGLSPARTTTGRQFLRAVSWPSLRCPTRSQPPMQVWDCFICCPARLLRLDSLTHRFPLPGCQL